MRTTSICVLIAIAALPSLANSPPDSEVVAAKRAASEALKATPFDLVCTFPSGPAFPESADKMGDTMRYVTYALLREHSSFELRSSGDGNMVLTPTERPPMNYVVTVAQPNVDGHPLLEFQPADTRDRSGDIYVRFPVPNAEPRWPDYEFTTVEHGAFSQDTFGAKAFTRAAYRCATPAQIKAYDPSESGVSCVEVPFPPRPDAKGVQFDCRNPPRVIVPNA